MPYSVNDLCCLRFSTIFSNKYKVKSNTASCTGSPFVLRFLMMELCGLDCSGSGLGWKRLGNLWPQNVPAGSVKCKECLSCLKQNSATSYWSGNKYNLLRIARFNYICITKNIRYRICYHSQGRVEQTNDRLCLI